MYRCRLGSQTGPLEKSLRSIMLLLLSVKIPSQETIQVSPAESHSIADFEEFDFSVADPMP